MFSPRSLQGSAAAVRARLKHRGDACSHTQMHRFPSLWPIWPAGAAARFAFAAFAALAAACTLSPLDVPNTDNTSSSTGGNECSSDADCDDQNPCTRNLCTSAFTCAFAPRAAGTPCGGGDICSGGQACDGAGTCMAHAPKPVDDGDMCTVDACDPQSGAVTHSPISGCVAWKPLVETGAPVARERHTAVWTGTKMIVWGGLTSGMPAVTASGGIYDPKTQSWAPTSMINAPPPRHSHTAVWTGNAMIVWGGYGLSSNENTGGIYDPDTDTWTPMSTVSAPQGRTRHSAVWSGNSMFVWGGLVNTTVLKDGGIYNPASNSWMVSAAAGALGMRYGHTAVWTGDKALVWGGGDLFDWLNDGKFFDPSTNAWSGGTSNTMAPDFREAHTALWTGNSMIVWGGWNGGPFLNDGGIFEPNASNGTWTATSTASAPSPRRDHVAVWTGNSMIVWGGCGEDSCGKQYGDGGVFTPNASGGEWISIPEQPALSPRRNHSAVWTGSEMIVWGGRVGSSPTNSGAYTTPLN